MYFLVTKVEKNLKKKKNPGSPTTLCETFARTMSCFILKRTIPHMTVVTSKLLPFR